MALAAPPLSLGPRPPFLPARGLSAVSRPPDRFCARHSRSPALREASVGWAHVRVPGQGGARPRRPHPSSPSPSGPAPRRPGPLLCLSRRAPGPPRPSECPARFSLCSLIPPSAAARVSRGPELGLPRDSAQSSRQPKGSRAAQRPPSRQAERILGPAERQPPQVRSRLGTEPRVFLDRGSRGLPLCSPPRELRSCRCCRRDPEGAGQGQGRGVGRGRGALAPNTSSPFPPEPPGASGSIIPVYCALLATVVLGLLTYVASSGRWSGHCSLAPPSPSGLPASSLSVSMKVGAGWQVPSDPHSWCSPKQRQQVAKARTGELGALNRDQIHGDSSVFLDSLSSLPCAPSQGPHPELGCRLYIHLPRQQQEEVERLLEVSDETDKGWQGLADRPGYQAEAVKTMAQGQAPVPPSGC
ncbi:hypothetical protein HPG69_012858 [Diceros bicornis minor]|uniref:Tumor necrosis factor receptor member 16 transmembrane domain-containing protein n=1 Tax=Diceros bicornis minor TaxID=77932 RepID=A0A7J7F156_DICBM|nr:hypothetical protein HPG69_012858 [Diceros bicornis minor]